MTLALQFAAAATGASNLSRLDEISRLSWRALAEGAVDDVAHNAIAEAVEARRRVLKGQGNRKALADPKALSRLRRPVSPDKAASLARRRRWAASGVLPPQIACQFTLGEVAALSVVAREVQRKGRCELPIDAIAAMAGVSRTTTQNALRLARRLGLLSVMERRRRGEKSDTNVVSVVSQEWRGWLRLHRVQKIGHHEYSKINQPCGSWGKPSHQLAFTVRSRQNLVSASPRVEDRDVGFVHPACSDHP